MRGIEREISPTVCYLCGKKTLIFCRGKEGITSVYREKGEKCSGESGYMTESE